MKRDGNSNAKLAVVCSWMMGVQQKMHKRQFDLLRSGFGPWMMFAFQLLKSNAVHSSCNKTPGKLSIAVSMPEAVTIAVTVGCFGSKLHQGKVAKYFKYMYSVQYIYIYNICFEIVNGNFLQDTFLAFKDFDCQTLFWDVKKKGTSVEKNPPHQTSRCLRCLVSSLVQASGGGKTPEKHVKLLWFLGRCVKVDVFFF